jgi:hypothetical protein
VRGIATADSSRPASRIRGGPAVPQELLLVDEEHVLDVEE